MMKRQNTGLWKKFNRKRINKKPLLPVMAAVPCLLIMCAVIVAALLIKIKSTSMEGGVYNSDAASAISHLYSPYAVLVSVGSGDIVAEHGSGKKIYPASLTKIMTAIIVIENADLTDAVVVPSSIYPKLYAQGASLAGFEAGEIVTARDLLYGLMLPSGAECALALAQFLFGSEELCVDKMNEKAMELGMSDTHYVNTTGLHNDMHFSTVSDIAALLCYCLKNDTFREVFTALRYDVPHSNIHSDGFSFFNSFLGKLDTAVISDNPDNLILGGKTGYTKKAGLCLASLAVIDGKEYILVTAGADGNHHTAQYNIEDAITIYRLLEGDGEVGCGHDRVTWLPQR